MYQPRLIVAAITLAGAASVFGQTSGQPTDPSAAGGPSADPPVPVWKLRIEPSLWYAAPGGKLTLPGGTSEMRLAHADMDNPRLNPFAEVHFRADRFVMSASGFSLGMRTEGGAALEDDAVGSVSFARGDALDTSFDLDSFDLAAGYRFIEFADNPRDGVYAFNFSLAGLGGARLYDVHTRVERLAGGVAESDEVFIEPYIGAKIEMEIYRDFTIDLAINFGGVSWDDRSTLSWDTIVGGTWRPVENVGLQIGYRQLAVDMKNGGDSGDKFRWRGAAAGLYAGLEIRF